MLLGWLNFKNFCMIIHTWQIRNYMRYHYIYGPFSLKHSNLRPNSENKITLHDIYKCYQPFSFRVLKIIKQDIEELFGIMQENLDILQKVSDRRYLKIDIPLEMLPWSSLQIKKFSSF